MYTQVSLRIKYVFASNFQFVVIASGEQQQVIFRASCEICRKQGITVPATDFDDMKVLALNLDKPKSQT